MKKTVKVSSAAWLAKLRISDTLGESSAVELNSTGSRSLEVRICRKCSLSGLYRAIRKEDIGRGVDGWEAKRRAPRCFTSWIAARYALPVLSSRFNCSLPPRGPASLPVMRHDLPIPQIANYQPSRSNRDTEPVEAIVKYVIVKMIQNTDAKVRLYSHMEISFCLIVE